MLLAAGLAASGGMMQVAVAVGTTTLVLVTGVKSIVGLGPAIFLSTAALAALPAGRAMDRYGRMPVISGGFVAGIVATATVALGCLWVSTPLVVVGLALVGASSGTVILSRAAAADMYPAERRARGISLVLFGAVFGAALGPLVFKPLFAGDHTVDTDSLVLPGSSPARSWPSASRSHCRCARIRSGSARRSATALKARRTTARPLRSPRCCAGRASCRLSSRRWRASR